MADLGKEFLNTIKKSDERKTQPFDAVGTVKRVKDGVAYVHFAGGVDETPVKLTINAQAGDEVQVRVADGRAWLVGNATSPPTDDAQAKRAIKLGKQANDAAARATKDAMVAHEAAESASADAKRAEETAESVEGIAEQAQTDAGIAKSAADKAVKDLSQVENVVGVVNWIAEHGEMISQEGGTFDPAKVYFIVDPNGDYHIGNTHYSIVTEPKAEDIDDYYILNINESVQNYVMTHLFVDEEGLWLIPEENATVQTSSKKILIAVGGNSHTYSDAGTYIIDRVDNTDQIVAKFTANETIIGDATRGSDKPRVVIGVNKTSITDGTRVLELSRNGITWYSFYNDTIVFTANTRNLRFNTDGLMNAGFEVSRRQASADEPGMMFANNKSSSISDKGAYATNYSFALGCSGMFYDPQTGESIDKMTSATGKSSFAQGCGSEASGDYSSSQGFRTKAIGDYSHASNSWTVAGYSDQTAIGKFNDNKSDNAFEIGNGTDDQNRSNGFEVDWDGKVECGNYQGKLTSLLDLTHPKGSTYSTVLPPTVNGHSYDDGNLTDADKDACGDTWFDPRIMWGGTWELMPEGYILLSGSESGSYQVGIDTTTSRYKEYGENSHILTADEIPAHTHGNKSLSGSFQARHYGTSGNGAQLVFTPSGIVDIDSNTGTLGKVNVGGAGSNGGYEKVTVNASHEHNSVGGGQAHNVMQKSIAVYTWIRTA